MSYQTTYGYQSDEAPRAGLPDSVNPPKVMPGRATTQIDFGDALEWVSEAAKTVKKFDGTGTICGFAVRDTSRVAGVGYSIGDAVSIAYEGLMWVNAGSVLTVGAVFAGVANSVVRKVATSGAQNLALVQFNMPARGPAL